MKGPPRKLMKHQDGENQDEQRKALNEEMTLEVSQRITTVGHSQAPRSVNVSHDDGMLLTLADKVTTSIAEY